MSRPIQFVIAYSSNQPLSDEMFLNAGKAICRIFDVADEDPDSPLYPWWEISLGCIGFGGKRYEGDRQEEFVIARSPTDYRREGADYPYVCHAISPKYIALIELVIELFNRHTDNALVAVRGGELITPRLRKTSKTADWLLAR